MKIISIGDIHGHDCWKKIIPRISKFDKVVFIGDYVDSFHFNNDHIRQNLLEIIKFKKKNPYKVVLLLGNHDIQYLFSGTYRCSGFRPEAQPDLTIIFNENKKLFQVAHQYKNYLWTHAGVSKKWFKKNKPKLLEYKSNNMLLNLAGVLNSCFQSHDRGILCEVSFERGGASERGGIFWADRSETRDDYLDGYFQICGHTHIDKITTIGNSKSSITYIDCLESGDKFYALNTKIK